MRSSLKLNQYKMLYLLLLNNALFPLKVSYHFKYEIVPMAISALRKTERVEILKFLVTRVVGNTVVCSLKTEGNCKLLSNKDVMNGSKAISLKGTAFASKETLPFGLLLISTHTVRVLHTPPRSFHPPVYKDWLSC